MENFLSVPSLYGVLIAAIITIPTLITSLRTRKEIKSPNGIASGESIYQIRKDLSKVQDTTAHLSEAMQAMDGRLSTLYDLQVEMFKALVANSSNHSASQHTPPETGNS
jgi:hypothetical protein